MCKRMSFIDIKVCLLSLVLTLAVRTWEASQFYSGIIRGISISGPYTWLWCSGSAVTLPPSWVFLWRDFQHFQKCHFFRSLLQVTVRNHRWPYTREATATYCYVVHGRKQVIVYHGMHRTDYGYAALGHFLKELWWYSHIFIAPCHRGKVTTVAKRLRFYDG